jgi:4-amino-4-deoxy-L-arabinose transferase-like glycosyltransferase
MVALLAIALRIGAALMLDQPLQSDGLAYFTMAQGLADRGELLDTHGQHAFYSVGYPLVLTPFFALLGSSLAVGLAVNLLLAAISVALIYRLTLKLSGDSLAGLIAAGAYAVWLPGIWNATVLARENLATPLLLGLALCTVAIARCERPSGAALLAGLLWGASLLTGGSALLTCAGPGVALLMLWRRAASLTPALQAGLCFVAGAALVVSPWLYSTDRMVGRPVLTTNGAFNLYLGNNPAATGRFVSIADTPLRENWEEMRVRLGEVGNAERLQAEALRWVGENPAKAGGLAALKLWYFWQPNVPDAQDFAASKAIAAFRVVEVVQYCLILILALLAFRSRRVRGDGKWILAAVIGGFWLIHAAFYVITRYRDPVMPLLIAMAAVSLAGWLQRMSGRKAPLHAA